MCTIITPTSFDDLEAVDRILNSNDSGYQYVIDLSNLTVVNSTFISALFRNPKHVGVMNVPPKVLEQFSILGVMKYIKIVQNPMDLYALI